MGHNVGKIVLDTGGFNALHYAAPKGDWETTRALLEFVTLAIARNKHGRNALHYLLSMHSNAGLDAGRYFLPSSVGINDLDDHSKSLLAVSLAKLSFL